MDQLLERLQPDLIAAGFVLLFLPATNPDGLNAGTRMLADGVGANRNWPTADWSADTYVAGPALIPGGGGPYPFSEPETQALGLDRLYAAIMDYARGEWVAYPVTGDFAQWTEDQGTPDLGNRVA